MALLNNAWNGRIRHAPLLNIAILVASVVTFGLAVSYANASIRTPMNEQTLIYKLPHPANRYVYITSDIFMDNIALRNLVTDLHAARLSSMQPSCRSSPSSSQVSNLFFTFLSPFIHSTASSYLFSTSAVSKFSQQSHSNLIPQHNSITVQQPVKHDSTFEPPNHP